MGVIIWIERSERTKNNKIINDLLGFIYIYLKNMWKKIYVFQRKQFDSNVYIKIYIQQKIHD